MQLFLEAVFSCTLGFFFSCWRILFAQKFAASCFLWCYFCFCLNADADTLTHIHIRTRAYVCMYCVLNNQLNCAWLLMLLRCHSAVAALAFSMQKDTLPLLAKYIFALSRTWCCWYNCMRCGWFLADNCLKSMIFHYLYQFYIVFTLYTVHVLRWFSLLC